MSFTTPNLMNVELPSPVAVVCHDAGAANLILAGLEAGWAREWRVCAEGPARRRFSNLFPDHAVCASLAEALRDAAALLSGTGWASSLEHEARRLAGEMGVFSVAVVDHWVNYPDRFVRNGEQVWPDEFWVTDALARSRYQGLELINADITHPSMSMQFDYVVMSGLFNLDAGQDPEWCQSFIASMYKMCRKATVFNAVSTHVNFTEEGMYYLNPAETLSYILQNLTSRVVLEHGVPQFNYTIVMYKEMK